MVKSSNMTKADDKTIEALVQLKKSSQMRLETITSLANAAIENYYTYATAKPEIAEKALSIVGEETNRIYLDYLEHLARLNEQITERLIDSSKTALKRCIEEVKNSSKAKKSKPNKKSRKTRAAIRSKTKKNKQKIKL